MSRISLIVAMAQNRVMGANNQMPWHLPDDLDYFKQITLGHHMIMGRKTHDAIGRVLPGRTSIVVTRNTAWFASGCLRAGSLEEGLRMSKNDSEIFIVGGGELFHQSLDIANRIYLTEIKAAVAGNTYFPPINHRLWHEIKREHHPHDSKHPYDFDFVIYDRR
ncbi:MAG TPA: dihydrofolate reductase [Burkholderiales bacterium]|nr:dihydrofolate reductase [Burkholderiales bacterium]